MSPRIAALTAALILTACSPTPTTTGTTGTPAGQTPSASPSGAVPGLNTVTYTDGTLEVDGAAVQLPTALLTSKLENGGAIARTYGLGIPADVAEGGWFVTLVYGSQGQARNLSVQINQRTGARPQDLLFLSFTRLDGGTGAAPLLMPADATGTVTEHDGRLDVSFSGTLSGIPASKHAVKANFPGLPLN